MSIAEMSVSGGTMILVTAVLRLIARDMLPRRGYVALWTAAILRLLMPFKIASPVSFYGLLSRTAIKVESPGAVAVEETSAGIPIWTVIWLAGMAVMGIAFAVSYIRCIRAFRTSTPLENKYIDDWLTKNSHWQRVTVRALPGLRTPLTYGLLRPVILLPEDAEGWDAERLGMVLCHELVHIRRFDSVLKKLAVLALCVHWWNPAVWLMAALLDRDMELACDGAVVEQLGPESRARYARLLIDLKAPHGGIPLVTGFGKNVTERRVRGVLSHRRAARTAVVLSAVLFVTVIAVFAATAQPESPEAAPTASSQPKADEETGLPLGEPGTESISEGDAPTDSCENPVHIPAFKDDESEPTTSEHPVYVDRNRVELSDEAKKITIIAVNESGEYVPVDEIYLEGDGE